MTASKEFPRAVWLGPPKSYTAGRKTGQPSVIVIHTTEGSEGPLSAENGAAYDRRRTDGTSTHFFIDSNGVVQTVYTYDEAHAARAHGNDIGIQMEVCGKAGQTTSQWDDAVSAATLDQLVAICVDVCMKFPGRFPVRRLTPAGVRTGQHGFCGHVDITYAFPEDKGTHTDPGSNFPWSRFLTRVQAGINARTTAKEDDDMPTAQEIATATVKELRKTPEDLSDTERIYIGKQVDRQLLDDFAKLGTALTEVSSKLDALTEKVDALASPPPAGS